MEMKILQINTNYSRVAQDLAIQRDLEELVGIICTSSTPRRETWFSDTDSQKLQYMEIPIYAIKLNS